MEDAMKPKLEDRQTVTVKDLKATSVISQLAGSLAALAVVGEAASDAHIREIVGRWAGLVRLVGENGGWGFDQFNAQLALLANDPSPQCRTLAQRIRNLSLEGLAGNEWRPRK
jgi:hypothetical protein